MRILASSFLGARCRLALIGACLAVGACSEESAESLLAAGKKAAAESKQDVAIVQFKRAAEKNPESRDIRFFLGQSLLEGGDPAAAVVELEKAQKKGYDADKVVPVLAEALLASTEFKKLATSFDGVMLKDPAAQASLRSSVAVAWLILGDAAKADVAVKAALAAVPDYGPARLLQARQLAGRGDLTQALATTDRALAADPKLFTGWMLKAELQSQGPNPDAAEESLQQVLKLEPRFVPAHAAVINRRLQAGDSAAAEEQLRKLRALLPNQPAIVLAEAKIAYQRKDLQKARELIQQYLRLDADNIEALLLSGAVEAQVGSMSLAETQFTKILQINPDLMTARINLARTYLRLGQPARTLEVLQPALTPKFDSAQAHASAAEAYLRLGSPDKAEAEYKRAAAMNPADDRMAVAVALSRLARGESVAGMSDLKLISAKSQDTYPDMVLVSLQVRGGQVDAALATIAEMERKHPGDASVAELRGRVYLLQQNPQAARAAFEQALKQDPVLYAATAQLAALDIREGKTDQARARYQASLKAEPSNYYAAMALAALQRRLGDPREKVEATLAAAITAAPNVAQPRLMLIDLMLKERRFKDALAQAGNATAALPTDTAVLEAAGRTAMLAGNLEQATSHFRRLSNLQPNSASPWLMLAELYASEGNKGGVETALKKAIEVEPSSGVAARRLLEFLIGAKREQEALQIGQMRQQRQPADPSGYIFESVTLVRLKKIDEAAAVLRKGLKAIPDSKDLPAALFSLLNSNERKPDAEKFAAEWLSAHPGDSAFDFQVSAEQMRLGDYAKSEARLTRILAAFPDNALALNNMAWILVQTGKPGALPYARRAVEMLPDDPNSLDTLAQALAFEKQYDKALDAERRAIDLAPGNYNFRLALARIAVQAGDKSLARKELQALQELGAKFPAQAEVTKLLSAL